MSRLPIFIFFLLIVFLANDVFASDSTKIKRGYILSISAGLTNNTVYGSMVDRNNQFGTNVKMENRGGYAINVNIEKNLSTYFFFQTGLNFIHKQVNPMVNTTAIYQDELKTDYLSIPIKVGVNLFPEKNTLNFALTVGTLTNLRIKDNSKIGPDRVAFKSAALSESLCGGVQINFIASPNSKLFLQYNYTYDISNSYTETLYWSSEEPHKDFIYKNKTHIITLGYQWHL